MLLILQHDYGMETEVLERMTVRKKGKWESASRS